MFEYIKKLFEVKEIKVADYPRGEYKAYWEIVRNPVPSGFSAVVRVNAYEGSELFANKLIISPTEKSLQKQMNEFLSETMKQYKRV